MSLSNRVRVHVQLPLGQVLTYLVCLSQHSTQPADSEQSGGQPKGGKGKGKGGKGGRGKSGGGGEGASRAAASTVSSGVKLEDVRARPLLPAINPSIHLVARLVFIAAPHVQDGIAVHLFILAAAGHAMHI